MTNKCVLLVKNRLNGQLGISKWKNESGKSKSSKWSKLLLKVFIVLVFVGYCGGYAYGLQYLGVAELIPIYAFLLCTIVTFIFTVFITPGELFGYRDYDFLMSIPIKTTTIIASRFIVLYVWNTIISFIIMIPMGIVYGIYIKPSIIFYFLWLISMFLVSFIPTTVAVVIGALISGLSSKLKNQRLMSGILQVALIAVILIVPYFAISSSSFTGGKFNQAYIKNILILIHDKFFDFYPVAGIFQNIVVNYSILDFAMFIVFSLGGYLLFVKVVSLTYKKINTALFSYHSSANYAVHSLKQRNVLPTLYSKELRQWYSCPIYLTNTTVGAILALVLAISMVILGPSKIIEIGKGMIDETKLNIVYSYGIAAFLGMCCTTMASISLEGKKVWLLQSLPIKMENIIKSKILVNLTITIPCGLICSTLYIAKVQTSFMDGVLVYLIPITFSLFSAIFGLWLNLRKPDYTWESEAIVIKQNLTALIGMLLTSIVSLIIMAIGIFTKIPAIILGVVVIVLLMILIIALYQSMLRKYTKVPQ